MKTLEHSSEIYSVIGKSFEVNFKNPSEIA